MPTDFSDRAREFADRAKDIGEDVRRGLDTAYNDARRGARRAQAAVDEQLAEGRRQVRRNPIAAISVFAAGGLMLGFLLGYLAGRNED